MPVNGQLDRRLTDLAGRYGDIVPTAAPKGRLTHYSEYWDRAIRYLTDDPTASKLKSLVRRIDDGDIAALCEVQLELERKDAQFAGVVNTRRNAVTALDWCIDPDPDHEDDSAAQEAADYLTERLSEIAIWPKVLEHLMFAIGPNVSVAEIIWERAEVADFVLVPCTRLTTHPYTNTGLAIKTEEELLGFPIELFPGKFIVHSPYAKGGFSFRSTLTHASLFPFLMGTLSRIDWLAFAELFATPMRVGEFDDNTLPDDRVTAQDMLDRMSTDTAAMLPKGIKVQFYQAQGTGETYQNQLHYVDNKIAILWLGQTLTTDVVATGSYAAARVHNKVRSDLLASDIRAEAATLREQLFRPMVRLKWPGRDIPIPIWKRDTSAIIDIDARKLALEQVAFAASQELPVPRKWLYDMLNIPRPSNDDAVVLRQAIKAAFRGEEKDEDAARKSKEREKEPEGIDKQ